MITEERLNLLYERFKKKAQTNYENYQASGIGQYYSEYNRQQEFVELCERAKFAVSDHEEAINLRTILSDLGNLAFDAIYKNTLDAYRDCVKEITHYMRITGIVKTNGSDEHGRFNNN